MKITLTHIFIIVLIVYLYLKWKRQISVISFAYDGNSKETFTDTDDSNLYVSSNGTLETPVGAPFDIPIYMTDKGGKVKRNGTYDLNQSYDTFVSSSPTTFSKRVDSIQTEDLKTGTSSNGGFSDYKTDFATAYGKLIDSISFGNSLSYDNLPNGPESPLANQTLTPTQQKSIVYQADGIPLSYEARMTYPSLAQKGGSIILNNDRKCSPECCQFNPIYSSDSCCVCYSQNFDFLNREYAFYNDQSERTNPVT